MSNEYDQTRALVVLSLKALILAFMLHFLSSQPQDESQHAAFKTYYMPPLDRKHRGY